MHHASSNLWICFWAPDIHSSALVMYYNNNILSYIKYSTVTVLYLLLCATLTTSGHSIVNHLLKECQHLKNALSSWMIAWERWKRNWSKISLIHWCQYHFHTHNLWRTVVLHLCLYMGHWCMSLQVQVRAPFIKMSPHTHKYNQHCVVKLQQSGPGLWCV